MGNIVVTTTQLTNMAKEIRTRKENMRDVLDDVTNKINSLQNENSFVVTRSTEELINEINSKKKNFEQYDAKVESFAKFIEDARDGYIAVNGVVIKNIENADGLVK